MAPTRVRDLPPTDTDGPEFVQEIGRVPSMVVPLDSEQELRFQRLMDGLVMIDLHAHTMVLPKDVEQLPTYLRESAYRWGVQGYRHGGWTTVGTANMLRSLGRTSEGSFGEFADLIDEIGLMLADLERRTDAVRIRRAEDVLDARQRGQVGFLPTVEHLMIGHDLHRVDVLYGIGIRLAGLTYNRKSYIGDGRKERTDCGLSEFGIDVVRRMNDLGMVIDLAHAGRQTALDAIGISAVPVVYSHNAAMELRPRPRTQMLSNEELLACAKAGGLVGVISTPNSLSDDPRQDVTVALDHYDYLIGLLGPDHVAMGTDTVIGDHVALFMKLLRRRREDLAADYLDGLESPADGHNLIRGLIVRGHSDTVIRKVAGGNALELFRRVIG